jgi:hypothetical protein
MDEDSDIDEFKDESQVQSEEVRPNPIPSPEEEEAALGAAVEAFTKHVGTCLLMSEKTDPIAYTLSLRRCVVYANSLISTLLGVPDVALRKQYMQALSVEYASRLQTLFYDALAMRETFHQKKLINTNICDATMWNTTALIYWVIMLQCILIRTLCEPQTTTLVDETLVLRGAAVVDYTVPVEKYTQSQCFEALGALSLSFKSMDRENFRGLRKYLRALEIRLAFLCLGRHSGALLDMEKYRAVDESVDSVDGVELVIVRHASTSTSTAMKEHESSSGLDPGSFGGAVYYATHEYAMFCEETLRRMQMELNVHAMVEEDGDGNDKDPVRTLMAAMGVSKERAVQLIMRARKALNAYLKKTQPNLIRPRLISEYWALSVNPGDAEEARRSLAQNRISDEAICEPKCVHEAQKQIVRSEAKCDIGVLMQSLELVSGKAADAFGLNFVHTRPRFDGNDQEYMAAIYDYMRAVQRLPGSEFHGGLQDTVVDVILRNKFPVWPFWRVAMAERAVFCSFIESQIGCPSFESEYTFFVSKCCNSLDTMDAKKAKLLDEHPTDKEPVVVCSFGTTYSVFFYDVEVLDATLAQTADQDVKKMHKEVPRKFYVTSGLPATLVLWMHFMRKYFQKPDKFGTGNYDIAKLILYAEELFAN